MNRRSLLKAFAGAPVAYVLGKGLVTEESEVGDQIQVGKLEAKFRVDDGNWQTATIPIYGKPAKQGRTLSLDYVMLTIDYNDTPSAETGLHGLEHEGAQASFSTPVLRLTT